MTVSSPATPEAEESPSSIALPTKRDEAWRYAPHALLGKLAFGPAAGASAAVGPDIIDQIPQLDGPRIVVVNGIVDDAHSSTADLPAGLAISTLAAASNDAPEQVAEHFGAGGDATNAFVALNRAYGGDGAVVAVADGTELGAPIHIVDIEVPDEGQNASSAGVVIHIGDGASATVVETRIGGGDAFGGSNIATTITIGSGATLEHVVLQDVPSSQVHLSHIEVTQQQGSEYRARSFNLGASYGRFAYDVHLAGEGASADLSGLYFGRGDQTLDQQVNVIHAAKDCTSKQSFRGVLDDGSTGVFSGGIDVRPGADGTDAEQSNDNLLLSDRAEVNTQPRLEILADEVACAHGATIGQLDDTALYYMRSRGIPAEDARRLLINGFADQAVDDVEIEALRTWITERLGHGEDDA